MTSPFAPATRFWRETNGTLVAAEMNRIRVLLEAKQDEGAPVAARLDELANEVDALQISLMESVLPAAIDGLVTTFRLSAFERWVLLLSLAPEWDPGLGSAIAQWHGSQGMVRPTPLLAASLLGHLPGVHPTRSSLSAAAPLRRFELVHLDDGADLPLVSRPMRLDDRMVDYLLGDDRIDCRIERHLSPVPKEPISTTERAVGEQVADALTEAEGMPLVQVVGRPGSGRRATACFVAAKRGWTLVAFDAARLPADGMERALLTRLLVRDAVMHRLAYYLDLSAYDPGDPAARVAYETLAEELEVPLFVAARQPWNARRRAIEIQTPTRDAAERKSIWAEALKQHGVAQDSKEEQTRHALETFAQQFEFGPSEAAATVRAAAEAAKVRGDEAGWMDVWRTARDRSHSEMEGLAQRVEPKMGWDDLVLPREQTEQLHALAGQCRRRHIVYESWGFAEKLVRGRGISTLFSGPSGTGKTMAAEVLARELDLAMYRVDLAGVVSKYIGETEKNLRKVFDAAEGGGAILFFDEADALFGKRSEVRDSHDRYANIEMDYLLQRMEDYRGLAILATNRKSHIDHAVFRRLRFVVDFPLPTEDLRRQIWLGAFPPRAPLDAIDWDVLARLEITGASIKSIALHAAFLAAEDGGVIGMDHLIDAAAREYSKIDRLVQPSEFGRYYPAARR